MSSKNNVSTEWLDSLRALAAFAVILLHCTVSLVNDYDNNSTWWVSHTINSICRFCVPIFLMISGVLLLGKDYSVVAFLKKRLTRIFLPFFLWSIIYFITVHSTSADLFQNVFLFFKKMKSGMEFHLWYVYMIIGVYLFIPIINRWILHAPKKEIQYFLVIWMLVIVIAFPIFNTLYSRVDLRYFSGYLGYIVLGYYLYKYPPNLSKGLLAILLIVSTLATILLTYYYSNNIGKFDSQFYKYLSPNIALSSSCIFLLFKDTQILNPVMKEAIFYISKYSYGIYLSHIFALTLVSRFIFKTNILSIDLLIKAIVCLVLSLAITYIINKLPLGKYISG